MGGAVRNEASWFVGCALVVLAASACAGPTPVARLSPGNHEITLRVAGTDRLYLVRVPPVAAPPAGYPVVLAFHGGGGTPWQFRDDSRRSALADREGFVLVHPAGTPARGLRRRFMTWNAGGCCGRAGRDGVDDVAFVAALLDDLPRRVPVDSRRVYATGHSNGGMITMRVGAELPERFAAIAPLGGVPRMEAFPPRQALPVLHIHSVDDPRALFAGGLGPPFPLTRTRVDHASVMTALDVWRRASQCEARTREGNVRRWTAPDGSVHTATRVAWQGCREDAPVVLLRLTGAGHGWPGTTTGREHLIGPHTEVVDADEEIWAFFARHAKPRP